jgi:dTDP-4-amino-4,6-dideoxygalactose transaminase
VQLTSAGNIPLTKPKKLSDLALHGGSAVIPAGPPEWPQPDPAVQAALEEVYGSGDWGRYHGPRCEQLTARLAEMHGVEFAYLVSSGTFAVELALRAVGVAPGDEVILAGYDFPGNFRAIEAIGAKPVLVDLAADSWSLDPESLPLAISERTKAILVSHLHGTLARMKQIVEFANEHRIRVVEDACQTPGATVAGLPAGTWGDVGVLSFGGSKLLTAGRGGAIVTRHAEILQRAKIFCERGNQAFPLSELQAAVLLPQLASLPERNKIRRHNVLRLLSGLGQVTRLSATCAAAYSPADSDRNQNVIPTNGPTYYKLGIHFLPVESAAVSREQFIAAIQAEGVALDAGFRGFTKRTERRCRRVGTLVHAERAMESTLLLHHPVLLQSAEMLDRVITAFRKVSDSYPDR